MLIIFITEKGGATIVLSFIMILFGKDIFSSSFGQILFTLLFAYTYLPSVYLQVEYYIRNRNMKVFFENKLLIVEKDDIQEKIEFKDIYCIIKYPSGTKKGESLFSAVGKPWGCYHYMRIITNSKKEIIITCLMNPKLYNLFDQFEGIKAYTWYPRFPSTLYK